MFLIPFAGRAKRFEDAVMPEEKHVYMTCLYMLKNREDARDGVQETLLRAYQAYPSFKGQSSVRTWLCRIASNVCIDMLRKKKETVSFDALHEKGFDIESKDKSAQQKMEDSEPKESLRHAVFSLPDDMRLIITLRDINGLSYAEVGQILDLPEGTVKSRIARARDKLKNILSENSKNTELFGEPNVHNSERRQNK